MDSRAATPVIDRFDDSPRKRKSGLAAPIAVGAVLVLAVAGMAGGILSGVIQLPGMDNGPVSAAVAAVPAATAAAGPSQIAPDTTAPTQVAQAAPAPAQQGQPVVTREETLEDWLLTCVEQQPDAAPVCSIMQRLVDGESGNALFIWRITQNEQGGLTGVWQTPQAVLLNRGLYLNAGTPEPLVIPYERCVNGACQAVATIAPDLLDVLSAATEITVGFVLVDGRQMSFPVSPAGLGAGIAALSQ